MNKKENRISQKSPLSLSMLLRSIDFFRFSTWSLIFSNLSVIFFALIDDITAADVLWIYWGQSVIIGVFNFINIISLKEFSTDGFKQGGKQALPTRGVKISTAVFFLFHYGFFHLIYAMFLGGFYSMNQQYSSSTGSNFVLYSGVIFFVSYLIEFISSRTKPSSEIPNIGKLMFAPYARIIPMHLTIILGGFATAFGDIFSTDTNFFIIVLFVMIKTSVDLITHSINFSGIIKARKTGNTNEVV
ncbi:MAG: hypothetical protein IPJ03_03025 [Ignavibacteriales bacterium]|nr:hypothetical protein [Ignavibacteriales bacterium]